MDDNEKQELMSELITIAKQELQRARLDVYVSAQEVAQRIHNAKSALELAADL